ncbi:MAG: 2-hydroxyacyl-CoA dehydratase [Deltaproteobacteria bacterium]|nr:2-hydroxyacyl-CoA dehydratase [Deltaproteobacteria bacterium]
MAEAGKDKDKQRLRASQKMKELMTRYYMGAKMAEGTDKKIAWITSGGPVEFLIAADVIPIYPENHGAMLGASRISVELCEVAENLGYSRDLCSYARGDIGSVLTKKSPIGGLPRPDFLLACNNICGTVLKWYQALSRLFNVPLFLLDTPFIHHKLIPESIDYVRRQFEELIDFIEKQTGNKFDRGRLTEVVRYSAEAAILWKNVLDQCANRPSPMSCFDAFINMAPIVTLRGTAEVTQFYREMKDELQERIPRGISAVPEEKFRLLWDNIPIWYKMRELSDLFASYGACLVADTYTNAWVFEGMDTADPLDGLALAYTTAYLNISLDLMVERILDLLQRFNVDGLIIHSNRSCKPYSLGQYDIQRLIYQKTGIPSLMIEADMTDSRVYSDAQVKTRVEAFMETLQNRKMEARV